MNLLLAATPLVNRATDLSGLLALIQPRGLSTDDSLEEVNAASQPMSESAMGPAYMTIDKNTNPFDSDPGIHHPKVPRLQCTIESYQK